MKQKIDSIIDLNGFPGFDADFTPSPGGSYVSVNLRGKIAYVAIQFPIDKSGYHFQGRLGGEISTQQGYQAAAMASLNVLAQINKYVGFENVDGLNHVDIYYTSIDEWDEAPIVANGASDVFIKALGLKGIHSRALFGVHVLPRKFCLGITASFTLV